MRKDIANQKRAKVRRDSALARLEFRYPSERRTAPAGVTSFSIKAEDPALRKLIDDAVAERLMPALNNQR
jgi:hypothetical protein